jgi:2-oxoglutarate-Fe(II)-dependent oxygenase superfamily protein
MPLQITRSGVTAPAAGETAALARAFAECHAVRLRGLLRADLLGGIRARLARAEAWQTNVHDLVKGRATELVFADETTIGLLNVLFNDAALFDAIRAIAGVPPIGSFHGRVYRMDAGAHADVWHTDAHPKYLAGLSVNLTDGVFEGGELHLRRIGGSGNAFEVANTVPGDAVLFRIDPSIEHMVTGVTGTVPRVAWAGWFHRDALLPELSRLAGISSAC